MALTEAERARRHALRRKIYNAKSREKRAARSEAERAADNAAYNAQRAARIARESKEERLARIAKVKTERAEIAAAERARKAYVAALKVIDGLWFTYKIQKRGSPANVGYHGGCHGRPEGRWLQHIRAAESGSDLAVHIAIREFGVEAFDFLALAVWDSRAETLRAEALNVVLDGTHVSLGGYNMSWDGNANWRQKPTDMTPAGLERWLAGHRYGRKKADDPEAVALRLANAERGRAIQARLRDERAAIDPEYAKKLERRREVSARRREMRKAWRS